MAACTVARMTITTIQKLFMACTLGIGFVGCVADPSATPETEAQTSSTQSALACTPGAETCDYGCGFDGSSWDNPTPTTDDCIIRCNATGTAWELVVDCGWAQNFPYSASCLNSQPYPICQNN